MTEPKDLVHLIVWMAAERGEKLTTLRLVKFLYLADLYFARQNAGRTLTGWLWSFVHYGPFCGEALEAIDAAERRGLITAQKLPSKYEDKDYRLFTVERRESPEIRGVLPTYVLGPLQDAVRRWADDTPGLLDYVYFHTEPMIEARPRERLDFSRAMRVEEQKPIEMLRLDPRKVRKAREATRALAEQYRRGVEAMRAAQSPAAYDDAFGEALRAMEHGEAEERGDVTGTAEIDDR